MHELDGDRGAGQMFLCGGVVRLGTAGGFGGKHDEQRAQPLAAGHDRRAGVRRERRPGGGRHPLQVPLDTGHPPAQPLAAVVEKRLDGIPIPATTHIDTRFPI